MSLTIKSELPYLGLNLEELRDNIAELYPEKFIGVALGSELVTEPTNSITENDICILWRGDDSAHSIVIREGGSVVLSTLTGDGRVKRTIIPNNSESFQKHSHNLIDEWLSGNCRFPKEHTYDGIKSNHPSSGEAIAKEALKNDEETVTTTSNTNEMPPSNVIPMKANGGKTSNKFKNNSNNVIPFPKR